MRDHVPSVRSRQLGQELLRAIQAIGCNATEMAGMLAWSPSKMSRLLSGKRVSSQVDIAAVLALCGVVGARRDEVLALAEDPYTRTWWQDYGARLPIRQRTLTDNEDLASVITSFDPAYVPDLLQTPNYARALLRALETVPDEEIEERVAELERRQLALDRPGPPQVRVFLDEYVLTRTGGGDDVMSEQAHHLLRLAVRPTVRLRVVPESTGIRDAKPFTLLEFAELPPVVYVESPTSAAFLERDDTVAAYRRELAELDRLALDELSSAHWLASLAERRSCQETAF